MVLERTTETQTSRFSFSFALTLLSLSFSLYLLTFSLILTTLALDDLSPLTGLDDDEEDREQGRTRRPGKVGVLS